MFFCMEAKNVNMKSIKIHLKFNVLSKNYKYGIFKNPQKHHNIE